LRELKAGERNLKKSKIDIKNQKSTPKSSKSAFKTSKITIKFISSIFLKLLLGERNPLDNLGPPDSRARVVEQARLENEVRYHFGKELKK